MADYETEDTFGAPDVLRRDWFVRQLKIQHHALSRNPGPEEGWSVGGVVRVDTIERMHRWADEQGHDPTNYVLDLQLPT